MDDQTRDQNDQTRDQNERTGDRAEQGTQINRRDFLQRGALAAGGVLFAASAAASSGEGANAPGSAAAALAAAAGSNDDGLQEATITDLQAAMQAGRLSSQDLVRRYSDRIARTNQQGPSLRAVIEMNPDAPAIAAALDAERKAKGPRGPLHGIPILLKDNIDTSDAMLTTAGSLALVGSKPGQDSFVAQRLREAGAVILGKTNLSEWANMRSSRSISGWSGRGGQTRNPFVLTYNPCGSSSGSAVAVSANLCAAALGTETDGSIVCPAHINGVVGVKPTVGLTSRAGVVPIAHSQDTVGPHARTVKDAAILLGALTGVDPRDPATAASKGKLYNDYTQFLDPNALRGARIGVPRKAYFGYSTHADQIAELAIKILKDQGAIIVDPADIPSIDTIGSNQGEMTVLLYELKADMAAYLSTRIADPSHPEGIVPKTLADLIAFNDAHASQEMPFFGQELFLQAQAKGPLTDKEYLEALATNHKISREDGIDAILDQQHLDALVAPTGGPAWPTDPVNGDHYLGASSGPSAIAGYPLVTVPAGLAFGLPVGLTFIGRAFSEPTLLKLAYAFEQASRARAVPRFLEKLGVE